MAKRHWNYSWHMPA